ncbi:hypothetical protein DVT68_09295 [Dyella solisilvae]|uniref:Uncharacterized protein n=1 Tax=Dyella solisilvae TaxID=1920168 RepID=A0A370K7U3_9GAMM|nr:patatin-like phospholipase family protein [Dyella solisilvae]RDI98703.1 hypothetical protein DVT68_09295 [Dyella solisilvae]
MTAHTEWNPAIVLGNADEQAAFNARRHAAKVTAGSMPVGLALSGGGIRSATFCFGLLHALAKNKVLHRVDYLSTVSGGGYIGASLGRLYQSAAKGWRPQAGDGPQSAAAHVEERLGADDSVLLWWLRNNGRYLTPAGGADMILALAGQLRSFLVTQFEVLMLAVLVACIVILPHLLMPYLPLPTFLARFAVSAWWWAIAGIALVALVAAYAYWFLGPFKKTALLSALLGTVVGSYGAYLAWSARKVLATQADNQFSLILTEMVAGLMAIVLTPAIAGWCWARWGGKDRLDEIRRVAFINFLAGCLTLSLLCAVLGALDMTSWHIRYLLDVDLGNHGSFHVGLGAGVAALLLGLGRFGLPVVQTASADGWLKKLPLLEVANVCGALLVLAIGLFWLTLLQILVFSTNVHVIPGLPAAPWMRWAAILLGVVAYLLLNGLDLQQLNRSSLHFFYRSRLARTYVSVGNDRRAQATNYRFVDSVLDESTPARTADIRKVTEQLKHDDVALGDYQPYAAGGPIHLINCCINQTRDDRTGTFNADRKGVCLTVSALGIEVGTQPPSDAVEDFQKHATLAQWVAISGAAIGTGMGSFTNSGLAALMFLSGLRLGYWQRDPLKKPHAQRGGGWAGLLRKIEPGVQKYLAMLSEMFAWFPGLRDPRWYVSDGGHFDNTGVYALLKRRLPLIIMADCGADPTYVFGDVENLIRKARIDYDAAIEFVSPASLTALAGGELGACFGTPDSIQPERGSQSLLLARIRYGDGSRGALLIVKPHCEEDLPLDVAGYADRNPGFPQQSTLNQFFSEEEWESYFHLGGALGQPIDQAVLDHAFQWAWSAEVVGTEVAKLAPPETPPSRSRRIAGTVGASLGAGAVLTALLAGWQALDAHREKEMQSQAAFASQADALLSDLGSTERVSKGFDWELDGRIRLVDSAVAEFAAGDDDIQTMHALFGLLKGLCDKTTDATLQSRCLQDGVLLQGAGRVNLHVGDSFADYATWSAPTPIVAPEPAPAPEGGAGNIAGATTPEATLPSPPPPPPPPPVGAAAAADPSAVAGLGPAVMTGDVATPDPPVAARPGIPGEEGSDVIARDGISLAAVAPVNLAVQRSAPASVQSMAGATISPGLAASSLRAGAEMQARTLCAASATQRFVLYTQIYQDSQPGQTRAVVAAARAVGLIVPGVENVVESAKLQGESAPAAWSRPALLYRPAGEACARALKSYLPTRVQGMQGLQVVPMPASLGGPGNILELWLPAPPGSTLAMGPGR